MCETNCDLFAKLLAASTMAKSHSSRDDKFLLKCNNITTEIKSEIQTDDKNINIQVEAVQNSELKVLILMPMKIPRAKQKPQKSTNRMLLVTFSSRPEQSHRMTIWKKVTKLTKKERNKT